MQGCLALISGEDGGAGRDRTGDLHNAIVALSQLSYGPTKRMANDAVQTVGVKHRRGKMTPPRPPAGQLPFLLQACKQQGKGGRHGLSH